MISAAPRHRFPRLVLAALVAVPFVTAGIGSAQARGFHFHGHVHVRYHVHIGGHVHVGHRAPVYRVRQYHVRTFHRIHHAPVAGGWVHVRDHRHPHYRVRAPWYGEAGGYGYYDGGVYFGFAAPPPPPPCCAPCPPVPAYYEPAPPAAVTVAAAAPLPRFGIGAFFGSEQLDGGASGGTSGGSLGVLGRFRLSRSFELEGELSKLELQNKSRVDRRLGASLLWDLTPSSSLSPYLVGGLGVSHSDSNGGAVSANRTYGEVGAGLAWQLSDSLSLALDFRAGASRRAGGQSTVAARTTSSGTTSAMSDQENYTRARLVALVYF